MNSELSWVNRWRWIWVVLNCLHVEYWENWVYCPKVILNVFLGIMRVITKFHIAFRVILRFWRESMQTSQLSEREAPTTTTTTIQQHGHHISISFNKSPDRTTINKSSWFLCIVWYVLAVNLPSFKIGTLRTVGQCAFQKVSIAIAKEEFTTTLIGGTLGHSQSMSATSRCLLSLFWCWNHTRILSSTKTNNLRICMMSACYSLCDGLISTFDTGFWYRTQATQLKYT